MPPRSPNLQCQEAWFQGRYRGAELPAGPPGSLPARPSPAWPPIRSLPACCPPAAHNPPARPRPSARLPADNL